MKLLVESFGPADFSNRNIVAIIVPRKKALEDQENVNKKETNASKLQAGLRELQSRGPTLKRRISGDLEQGCGIDLKPLHHSIVPNHTLFGKRGAQGSALCWSYYVD